MRLLLLADVHANPWALSAIFAEVGLFDHLLFAGDAINYGPDPQGALELLIEHQAVSVRGNHDHAVAFLQATGASSAKAPLAEALRDWTREQLSPWTLRWLVQTPLSLIWEFHGLRIGLVHATPQDPLYDYRLLPQAPPALLEELIGPLNVDLLVVGHTHLPFVRRIGKTWVVNPGSAGQPLDGHPEAAYALFEGEEPQLGRAAYAQGPLLEALDQLPLTATEHSTLQRIYLEARLSRS